ncbi:MAG: DUF4388 domain-containing protein [Candidatus Melainabacteria bacterium]|nr:DUF4388 domain-containing protein [Candidatus Melainabacteria bacterium]
MSGGQENSSQQGGAAQRLQRLVAKPGPQDLRRFLTFCQTEKNVLFQFVWKDPGINEEFLLTIIGREEGAPEWRMLSRSGAGALELWYAVGADVESIQSRINTSLQSMVRTGQEKVGFDTMSKLPRVVELSGDSSDDSSVSGSVSGGQAASQSFDATRTFDSVPIFGDSRLMTSAPEVLKGNLAIVSITNLLQSIKLDRMSGRLRIQRQSSFADVFFEDGVPTHAEGSRGVGEECLLQAICWQDGDFQFEHKLKTDEKTISTALDRLVLDGAMLMDCTVYLKGAGLQMGSVLVSRDPSLTADRVPTVLREKQSYDPELETKVYAMIDGRRTVQEIVEGLWLTRSRWVFAIASLLRLDLITLRQSGGRSAAVEPKALDPSLIESVENKLLRDDTGLYDYSSFLYLLNHHINSEPDVPLSVILLAINSGRDQGEGRSTLSPEGFQLLWREISGVANFRGIISHYENDLGLLLFNTEFAAAEKIARAILKSLPSSILELAMTSTDSTFLTIGCASFPEDAQDMPTLLAVAESARERARQDLGGAVMARDLDV